MPFRRPRKKCSGAGTFGRDLHLLFATRITGAFEKLKPNQSMKTRPHLLLSGIAVCSLLGPLPALTASDDRPPKVNRAAQALLASRRDVRHLPKPLKTRLLDLAGRPATYLPLPVFSEADSPSQLFAYYLLDTTGFEPNIFTTIVDGVN